MYSPNRGINIFGTRFYFGTKGGRKMGQLDLLWEYQELEQKMASCQKEKKKLPVRHKLVKLKRNLMKQQDKLLKLNEEADKKSNELSKIHHEYESMVSSLNSDRDKITDGSIKNLKQLEQIEKNADNLKQKIDKKEEELLQFMKDFEQFNRELDSIRRYLAKVKRNYNAIKSEYDQEVRVINQGYREAKQKRDELKKQIDKELLNKYQTLKSNYQMPVAIINGTCCDGCNMQLASLVVQNVKAREKVVECENCGRILYMPK